MKKLRHCHPIYASTEAELFHSSIKKLPVCHAGIYRHEKQCQYHCTEQKYLQVSFARCSHFIAIIQVNNEMTAVLPTQSLYCLSHNVDKENENRSMIPVTIYY